MSEFVIAKIRSTLAHKVRLEACDAEVLELLWDGDSFTYHEDALWDFKSECSVIEDKKGDESFVRSLAELVKDVVAFYNSAGGFLIIGFDDKKRELCGFEKHLCIDDLKQRIKADIGQAIEFVYRLLDFRGKKIGLLFVPRRPDSEQPIRFKKTPSTRARSASLSMVLMTFSRVLMMNVERLKLLATMRTCFLVKLDLGKKMSRIKLVCTPTYLAVIQVWLSFLGDPKNCAYYGSGLSTNTTQPS